MRVDIFYRRFPVRRQAIVNAAGALFMLIPVSLFIIFESWDYVLASWHLHETSREAGGLIYPLPSILKTMIPVMSIMLLVQGIVLLLRSARQITAGD